jgi:RNA polymerase sigma-70 factor (ECF subfamily)
METLADHNLLLRIGVRDERALAALYDRYSGLVYTLALRIVGDRDLAQEVLQDVFWQCWQGAGQYDQTRGRVAAWLMGIARNRAVDLLRSRQHQARLREGEALALPDDRGRLVQQDSSEAVLLRQVVRDALTALPTAQRQTIELAYYDGLTQAEIAQKMEAPLGTVKTRMRDALERLRHRLRPLIEPASVDKENR